MHAVNILHRIVSAYCPHIHARRLTALFAAVAAAIKGRRLTLTARAKRSPARRTSNTISNASTHWATQNSRKSVMACIKRKPSTCWPR